MKARDNKLALAMMERLRTLNDPDVVVEEPRGDDQKSSTPGNGEGGEDSNLIHSDQQIEGGRGGEEDGKEPYEEELDEDENKVTEFSPVDELKGMETVIYAQDFHKMFDYVFVFPLILKIGFGYELTKESVEVTMQLKKYGAEVFPYLSVQKDELIVLIKFPTDVLRKYAHNSEYVLPLDPVIAEEMLAEGDKDNTIAPIIIPYDEEKDLYHPMLYMYGKYDMNVPEELYYRRPDEEDPFTSIVRIKLTKNIIQGATGLGGCNMLIANLISCGVLLGAYPMHEPRMRKKLLVQSINPYAMPWHLPFADMNDYFGEKLTLYFVFMSTYSMCLRFPAFVGIIVQYMVFASGDYSHWTVAFFCPYIALWSLNFTENIEHVEDVQAMRWGTWHIDNTEERGEYIGKKIQSPITGRLYLEGDPIERKKKIKDSIVYMIVACLMSLGVVSAIYMYRYYLYHKDEVPEAGIDSQRVGEDQPGGEKSLSAKLALQYASCINAVQIQVFNLLFTNIAIKLTEGENHRTEEKFEYSLVSKIFVFLAVNSFTSFIYIAYCFPFELDVDIFYNYDAILGNETSYWNESWPTGIPTAMPSVVPTAAPSWPAGVAYNLTNFTAPNITESACATSDCEPQARTGFREGYDANHLMFVAVNWTTLFVMKHIIILFTDMVIPFLYYQKVQHSKLVGAELPPTEPEKDFMLHPYKETENSLNTYGDSAIFFGCYALFGSAVPMASLLVFLQNWLKVKTDMWRHMLLYQRPYPSAVSHAGAWKDVFDILAYLAVISNAATICFSMDTLAGQGYSIVDRFWFFITLQWIVFFLHYILRSFRSKDPAVLLQEQRSDFVVSKLIQKEPDKDYYHLTGEDEPDAKGKEDDENEPLLTEKDGSISITGRVKIESVGSIGPETVEEETLVVMKYPLQPRNVSEGFEGELDYREGVDTLAGIELVEDEW